MLFRFFFFVANFFRSSVTSKCVADESKAFVLGLKQEITVAEVSFNETIGIDL